jgi:ketosteroid isomerase-like protein
MVRDDEAVAEVQGAYADFQRGDIPSLLNRMTDDVVWTTPGEGTAIPNPGRLQGKAQVAKFFEGIGATLDFHEFNPNEFIAQGDVVVALGTWDATVRGTDVRIQDVFAMVFRLRDGKIADFRQYSDSRLYAEAMASLAKK